MKDQIMNTSTVNKGTNLNIQLQDIILNYDDLGEGKLPIIFIHGFPFDKSMWQPQMDYFSKINRVISFDIRGFGKSSSGNTKGSMSLFADDLIRMMDSLKIEKAIVCGLSMGGYILLNAIARFPERFEAIVLCDTQCLADSPEVKEKREKTIQHILEKGYMDFAENFVNSIFCRKSLNNNIGWIEKMKHTILSTPPLTITGTLSALAQRWEMCSGLGLIKVPTLILCGSEDSVAPPEQSKYLHDHIENSTWHTLNDAGHMSNLEQSELFNRHLSDFVSEL